VARGEPPDVIELNTVAELTHGQAAHVLFHIKALESVPIAPHIPRRAAIECLSRPACLLDLQCRRKAVRALGRNSCSPDRAPRGGAA